MEADLRPIGWMPLKAGDQLGPWDMIWTRANGRVEIEVLEEGEMSIDD